MLCYISRFKAGKDWPPAKEDAHALHAMAAHHGRSSRPVTPYLSMLTRYTLLIIKGQIAMGFIDNPAITSTMETKL